MNLRFSLILALLALLVSPLYGQDYLPYPVNTEYNESSAALLPDSSIVLYTERPDSDAVLRFVHDGDNWVESPNILTEQINSLMVRSAHVHFRFSQDYERFILLLHEKNNRRVFESIKENGEWSYLKEILKDVKLGDTNRAYAYSPDNTELYIYPRVKPYNQFIIYTEIDGEWKQQSSVTIPDFDTIYGIIPINDDSFLFEASHTSTPGSHFFLVKRIEDDLWSTPLLVRNFSTMFYDLASTPFPGYYITSHWDEQNVGIGQYPVLVKNEFDLEVTINQVAENSTEEEYYGEYYPEPINSNGLSISPVLLPDSTFLLSSDRSNPDHHKLYKFRWNDSEWVEDKSWQEDPADLIYKINHLMRGEGEILLRFTDDYQRLILSLRSGNLKSVPNRYFEAELIGGQWTFFEILKDTPLNILDAVEMSNDGNYLFCRDNNGKLYQFSRNPDNTWGQEEEIKIFSGVAEDPNVVEIYWEGNNTLLAKVFTRLERKQEPDDYWFTSQRINGRWTAPLNIGSFSGTHITGIPGTDIQVFTMAGKIGWNFKPRGIESNIEILSSNRTLSGGANPSGSAMSGYPDYYALLIGVNDYKYDNQDLSDLVNPVEDMRKLERILLEKYTFSEDKTVTLENPDRADIINSLDKLSREINPGDNLLIFYAGHGKLDEVLNKGYWLPADAQSDNKANWIMNSTITEYIDAINSKHTLLISDACFSGSIFQTRDMEYNLNSMAVARIYSKKSRKAMTSGSDETVPDESVFMKYLLKTLEENEAKNLRSKDLFFETEKIVLNNTFTTPRWGIIQNTGDEGGDFIFFLKKK